MSTLFKKFLEFYFFRIAGWTYDAEMFKGIEKCVVLGAPHTSNWDFLLLTALFQKIQLPLRFTIKKEWLKWPFKGVLVGLGALGINRPKAGQKMTDVMTELFIEKEKLILVVTPEGSRSARNEWKSGFYYIALKAKVPIALGTADYRKKITGIGKVIHPTGDFEKDMKEIMDFYKTYIPLAKYPDNFLLDKRFI